MSSVEKLGKDCRRVKNDELLFEKGWSVYAHNGARYFWYREKEDGVKEFKVFLDGTQSRQRRVTECFAACRFCAMWASDNGFSVVYNIYGAVGHVTLWRGLDKPVIIKSDANKKVLTIKSKQCNVKIEGSK